jgi:hypothetical protein
LPKQQDYYRLDFFWLEYISFEFWEYGVEEEDDFIVITVSPISGLDIRARALRPGK